MDSLYNHPPYYEIAFSYRDIKLEVDLFEECFRRYSRIPVKRVLELGSGISPHMVELTRRGYEYLGLDTNPTMLEYARRKAEAASIPATLIQADMKDYSLERPVDFVYVMLGSLYVKTNEDLHSHLTCVTNALKSGGLYLLDWCINFQWDDASYAEQCWTMEREGIKMDVKFASEGVIDRVAQISRHKLSADVDDHGKIVHLESVEEFRTFFPQEFLLLVEQSKTFEFIGWWNNWNLNEPVEKAVRIDRPITLIRRI